jgi:hypothetical protein
VYDIFKAYKRSLSKTEEELYANLKEGTPGYRIFQKPMLNSKVEFDYTLANDEPMGDLPKVLAKRPK